MSDERKDYNNQEQNNHGYNNQDYNKEQELMNESQSRPSYNFWAEQINLSQQDVVPSENTRYYNEVSASSEENTYHEGNPSYGNSPSYDSSNFYGSPSSYEREETSPYNRKEEVIDTVYEERKEPVRKGGFIGKAVKTLLGAAVFGIVAAGSFIGVNHIYSSINPDAAPIQVHIGYNKNNNSLNFMGAEGKQIAATTITNGVINPTTSVKEVVKSTMPSIVTITSTFTQNYNWFGRQGSEDYDGGGSGIIVGENDTELLIATNNHVVEGAKTIVVNFIDEEQAEAIIKGTDAIADLAVVAIQKKDIKAETLNKIKIAQLGNSEDVEVGEMAIAIGNALGYGQSTTVGYISAKDREVAIAADKTMVLLQTDAAINPGNSGGALLNMEGEVIGINTVKYAANEVEGMGFAIPISRAMPIINDLMNREVIAESEKGYLGVYIDNVTEEVSSLFNWPVGVLVKSPIEGGAAQKAGVVNGDIIVKVDDTEVTNVVQLQEKIGSYRYGTEVKLTIMRNINGEYKQQEITVTLSQRPVE